MPKYLFMANYSAESAKAIMSNGGTARRTAIEKMVSELGGRLESFHFAFGDNDAYVLVELPDNKTATAVALTVNGSGAVTTRTVALLTPEEVDEASKIRPAYRPPGAS
ncbi:MAG TPA: GYD domain-containing protein [Geodermatophilus sp.]|nr:GYD domain-containing protein [Geodermatophilus sp.]